MNKLLSMLGLARRAGKLEAGFDAAAGAIRQGRARGVAVCGDVSEKTLKNIRYEAEKRAIPVLSLRESMEEAAGAVGMKQKTGVFAVCDPGFFQAIRELTLQENHDTEERESAERADGGRRV